MSVHPGGARAHAPGPRGHAGTQSRGGCVPRQSLVRCSAPRGAGGGSAGADARGRAFAVSAARGTTTASHGVPAWHGPADALGACGISDRAPGGAPCGGYGTGIDGGVGRSSCGACRGRTRSLRGGGALCARLGHDGHVVAMCDAGTVGTGNGGWGQGVARVMQRAGCSGEGGGDGGGGSVGPRRGGAATAAARYVSGARGNAARRRPERRDARRDGAGG